MNLTQWAIRNGVSAAALQDLRGILGMEFFMPQSEAEPHTEAWTQSVVRLEAAQRGIRLFRNNVGAFQDVDGRWLRYGLANESKRINEAIKSGDLIGWRPIVITSSHVGHLIAQFVSRECKRPGWKYSGDEREAAQLKWAELVIADGGDAAFCSGKGTL